MFGSIFSEKTDNKVKNLARSAMSEFKYLSKANNKNVDSVFDIAKSLEETTNWNIKSIKTEQIRSTISDASISDLFKYMKSNNEIVRSIACQVFAECKSQNLLNCLEIMFNDESENLRASCMETLYNLQTVDNLSLFEKGMKDKSPKVRMKAAIGIAEMAQIYNNKRAIELLNEHINDKDQEVREFIIDEIGLIGNENSVMQLFKAMEEFGSNEEDSDLISESLSIMLSKAFS